MLFKLPLLLLSHCLSAVVARPSEAPKSLPRRQDASVPPQSICGEIIEAVNDGKHCLCRFNFSLVLIKTQDIGSSMPRTYIFA